MPADLEAIVAQKRRADALLDAPEWDDGEPPLPEQEELVARTIATFQAAGPEVLATAMPRLWAYDHATVDDAPDDWRAVLPQLASDADIWAEVDLNEASIGFGGSDHEPAAIYLSLSGEVSWEVEHGVDVVFGDGVVVKVGPIDGHRTDLMDFDHPVAAPPEPPEQLELPL